MIPLRSQFKIFHESYEMSEEKAIFFSLFLNSFLKQSFQTVSTENMFPINHFSDCKHIFDMNFAAKKKIGEGPLLNLKCWILSISPYVCLLFYLSVFVFLAILGKIIQSILHLK